MESSLRDWLALQGQTLPGVEAALLVLGASERAPGASVAHWPSRERVPPRLSAAVEAALAGGRAVLREPATPRRAGSLTELALPFRLDGRLAGALGVAVRGVPQGECKRIGESLAVALRGLGLLVGVARDRTRLAERLSLAGCLLDHEDLAVASHALAAEVARRIGCETASLGLRRRGRLRVIALSGCLRFKEESDSVRALRGAMQEAVEQDAVIELPAPETSSCLETGANALLARGTGSGAVCTIPLASRGACVGALSCVFREATAISPAARESVRDVALLCGPILELQRRAEAGPLERARDRLVAWSARQLGADRAVAAGALALVALVLLLLAVVPVPYRVSARATLEGRVQRALVAAVDGYVAEAHARAGDLVAAGDLLARLDDRDLRLEHRRWASQKEQLEKEYREALATQDRTQVSILRAQLDKAAAQLALATEELGRTEVTAPFDGIVLEGDLDRALGSPVRRGDVLFEVAPLDGYRIILQVDDRDVADVREGQTGRLALSALPGERLPLRVERVTPIATTDDGRNYFRVEAALEEPAGSLRPGMEGVAKVDVDRRRLLWIWTHELFDWLLLRTWTLLP